MQFQVPQFIDIESKIVGPLTLRQFLYLAGAGGIGFISFWLFEVWLWFIVTAVFSALAIALAFAKYNGQPLIRILFYAMNFFWKPRLYIWQRKAEEKIFEIHSAETERKNLSAYFSEMPSVKKLWRDIMTTKTPLAKREKPRFPYWGRSEKERLAIFKKLTGEKEIARRIDYR